MEKQQIAQRFKAIRDPYKEKEALYAVMDALEISYKRTNCKKCISDYYNIVKQELDPAFDAAEHSQFDENKQEYELIYNYPSPVKWNGIIVSKKSPKHIHEAFYKEHPNFYIKQLKINNL